MLIRRAVSLFSRIGIPATLKSSAHVTPFSAHVARPFVKPGAPVIARSPIIETVTPARPIDRAFFRPAVPVAGTTSELVSTHASMSQTSTLSEGVDPRTKTHLEMKSRDADAQLADRTPTEPADIHEAGHESKQTSRSSSWRTNLFMYGYPTSMLMLLLSGCIFITKDFDSQEKEITHSPLDLKSNDHHGYIVDAKDFIKVGDTIKSRLSGCIVEDTRTGNRYFKKGASSLEALIKEFFISNFLSMIPPGEQPESLLMQEIQPDGSARFYTLSRIFPNSMDLEDFISRGNWKEKLAKKPLLGFEVAMAADLLFAKQQDMKFANYVVIEKEDCYLVVCIDHEKSGQSLKHKSTCVDKIDDEFLSHIVDLNEMGMEYRIGLYDNPDAREFMKIAQQFMKIENIQEFYKKVANMDSQKILNLVQSIEGRDGIIDEIHGQQYKKELLSMCKRSGGMMIRENPWGHFAKKSANLPIIDSPTLETPRIHAIHR